MNAPPRPGPAMPGSDTGMGAGLSPSTDGDRPAPRSWEVILPPGLKILNQNDRIHWAQRLELNRVLKDAAIVMCRKTRLPRLRQVRVMVVYDPPPDWRSRDADNIAASAKPLIDGMRAAGVVPDDNSRHVLAVTCMISATPFPQGRLRMIVTEISAGVPPVAAGAA